MTMLCDRLTTPEHTGYSFSDPKAKAEWIELLGRIRSHIHENRLFEHLVFHGTSEVALEQILAEGLSPGLVNHALMGERRLDPYSREQGSFWGTLDMAAYFAEDTALERHPGARPVLLGMPVSLLERDCELLPDAALVDEPILSLTMLDDPEIREEWLAEDCENGWRSSLHDIGAIVAIHDFLLEPADMSVIRSFDDYLELASRAIASQVKPGGI